MQHNTLSRGLKSRHMTMIALGGALGTGIFMSSGGAIYTAGPGGALLAFMIIGLMIYFLMTSLGEMSALYPVTGSFCEYCTRFVNPAFGFSMSYNYWFNWSITVAAELSAASIVMQFWFPDVPIVYWSALFFFLIVGSNLFTVRLFGEIEYCFSTIKVTTIILFICVGLLMIVGLIGNHTINFQNWVIGDAPFHNGWFGIISVMLVAGFSFQGTEIFGVVAGEVENPKENIPKAIKNIFWRILLFYIVAIAIISFIIPYTDPALINQNSNVSLSPFTIVFKQAGFRFAATIINLVVLTAILSAANASMYTATRTLWYMSKQGIAPKVFGQVTGKGVPIAALMLTSFFGAITFLSLFFGGGKIFMWLVNLSSLSGFIAWIGIAISHYCFRREYVKQGNFLDDLPYKAKLYPFGPLFTLTLCSLIIIGQQFITREHFDWGTFIGTYISIPLFVMLYMGYNFYYRVRAIPLSNKLVSSSD